MSHSNEFWNFGNADRSEDTPKGYFTPLFPHNLGRPLHHPEQDYNAHLISQIIKGFRVIGSGTDGVMTTDDLELGIKLHEVNPTDADYLHYIACGCKDEEWIWVPAEMGGTATSPLSVGAIATDGNVCNNTLPSISAYGQGGAGQPYEYSLQASNAVNPGNITDWSPVGQFSTFNGVNLVVNQTYFVYVKDALNSFAISSAVTVGEIVPLEITLSNTDATQPNGDDGTITVNVVGGIGSYTYTLYLGTDPTTWSQIGAAYGPTTLTEYTFGNPNASIGAGDYTVVVNDASTGCSDDEIIIVSQPASLSFDYTKNNATCHEFPHQSSPVLNSPDSFIFENVTGGTAPYEYSITDPNTTGYTWVTDTVFEVPNPGGGANVTIYPAVKDATGYIYETPGGVTFYDPDAYDFQVNAIDANCTTNLGSIIFSGLTGGPDVLHWGSPEYWQFSVDDGTTWAPDFPAPFSVNSISTSYEYFVPEGFYEFCRIRRVYEDSPGVWIAACPSSAKDATVGAADSVEFNISTVDDSICGTGGDGEFIINDILIGNQNASLDYDVIWTGINGTNDSGSLTGQSIPNITIGNINAGDYIVKIIDNLGGCEKEETVTIGQPVNNLTFTVDATGEVLCGGTTNISYSYTGATGSINIYDVTDPTTIIATGNAGIGSGIITISSAGTYIFEIEDSATQCRLQAQTEITEVIQAVDLISLIEPTCGSDGSIEIDVTNATGELYQLIVLPDANGNGGGAGSPQTSGSFNGLDTGDYQINITGGAGNNLCVPLTYTFTLAGITPLILTLDSQTNITCNGDSDGAINVSFSGPLTNSSTILWTGPNSYTSNILDISNLEAGTYNLTYTDNDTGCSANLTVILTEPDAIVASTQTYGGGCGSIHSVLKFSATGGTGNYTFDLYADNGTIGGEDSADNLIDTQTGILPGEQVIYGGENWNQPTIWDLPDANGYPGFYYIKITDDNGCTTTNFFEIPPCQAVAVDNSTVACNGGDASSISVTTTDGSGSYEFSDDNSTWSQTYIGNPSTHTFNGIYQGGSSYTFYVRNTNNPTEVIPVTHTVVHPDPVSATMLASTDESIAGAVDGAINLQNIIGGSGSYATIELYNATSNAQIGSPISSPVQNTPYTFSGLSADSYYVIVTDDNGCESDKIFATIGVAGSPLTFISYPGNIQCFGGTTDVNVIVSGGSGTFRFSNDNGSSWTNYLTQASYNFTGMVAGTHTIIVEDQQSYPGNPADEDITLNQPTEVIPTINSTSDETISGQNDGTISIEMSGGSPDYIVSLYDLNGLISTITGSVGQTTYQWSNLAPGTYSYTVEDSNGCGDDYTNVITIASGSPQIGASLAVGVTPCNGESTDVTMTVTGGSGNYRYATNPSNNSQYNGPYDAVTQATTNTWNVIAGTRYFFVEDADTGTIASSSITVTQYSAIISTSAGFETYPGADDAEVIITVSGGTAPYTVTSGSETQTITTDGGNAQFTTITSEGTYTFNVLDDNGCTDNFQAVIGTQYTNLSFASVTSSPSCYGENSGSISFVGAGGSNNANNYEWSIDGGPNGGTWTSPAIQFSNLSGGTYDLWLRDSVTGEEIEYTNNPINVQEGLEIQVITSTMTDGTCNAFPEYYIKFSGSNLTSDIAANQSVQITWDGGSPIGNITNIASLGNNEFEGSISFDSFFAPENNNGTFNVKITSDGCEEPHGPISYTSLDDIVLTVDPVSIPECPSDEWTYNVSAVGGTNTNYKLMTAPNTLINTWDGSILQITLPHTQSGSTALLAQDVDYANNGCQSNAVAVDTREVSELIVNGSVNNPNCASSGGSTYSFTITGGLPGGTANNTYKYKISTDGGSTYPGTVYDYTGAVGPVGISNGDIYIKAYRIVDTNSTEGNCDVEEGLGIVTNPIAISGSINSAGNVDPTACSGAGATGGVISMSITGGTGSYEFSYDGGNNYYTLTEVSSGIYEFTGLTAGTYAIVAQDTNGCIAFTDTVTLVAPNSPVVQSHKIEGCWRDADGASVTTTVSVANNGTQNSAGLYEFTDTTADAPTTNTTGVFTYSSSDMTTHVQAPITIKEISTQCEYVMNSFPQYTAVPSLTSSGAIGNFNNTPSGNPTGTYDTDDFKVWNIGSGGNTGYGGPYTVELIDSNGNVFQTINNATTGNNYIYDVPSGDYTYKIYDNTGLTGCGRTYTTPMTSTQQVLNEETFYHIHTGGGNVAPYGDLMSTTATWYTSAGTGTQDINTIMADMIDNGDGTTYPSGVTMPDVGTFEFAGPITGNNCGQTWTHNASSGQNYYYLTVPDNSSFSENLVTDGVFQYQCNGLTSYATARRAFTYNSENYWLYKLVPGTGTASNQYGFK